MRKAMAVTGALALPLGLALAAAPAHAQAQSEVGADDTAVLHAQLQPLNESSAGGTAMVQVKGTEVTVDIESTGLKPNVNAAQNFHIGGQDLCSPGSETDEDSTGVVSRSAEDTFQGSVTTSLTTTGSTRPEDGLSPDSMPPANGKGEVSYHRTFEVQEEVAQQLKNGEATVVQHSVSPDGAEEDGPASDDPEAALDEGATQPAICGELVAAPENGMDTGFGGTADDSSGAGLVGIGTAGMVGVGAGLIAIAAAAAIGGRLLWSPKA